MSRAESCQPCADAMEASGTAEPQRQQTTRSSGSTLTVVSTSEVDRAVIRIIPSSGAGSTGSTLSHGRDRAADAGSGLTLLPGGPWNPVRSVGGKRLQAPLKHRNPERQYHAKRLVVDDYGDAVLVAVRCSSCARWSGKQSPGWCSECKNYARRVRRDSDPEAARARWRELRVARLESDPEAREQERRRVRRSYENRKHRDPERMRSLARARAAIYRARMREDAVRRQAYLERLRIGNALRAMDVGRHRPDLRRVDAVGSERPRKVAVAPLAVAFEAATCGSEVVMERVCELAQISDRSLRAWRKGDRRLTTTDTAERMLRALDLQWWEVYDAERWPVEHQMAAKAWGDG